jgi:hypothetical protein
MFKTVDTAWRKLMNDVRADMNIKPVTSIDRILEILIESRGLLEQIQSGILFNMTTVTQSITVFTMKSIT